MTGEAAAIRCITGLQPAGGKGDKVFPPTYAVERNATSRYALEKRRIDGQEVDTVLLDSVASQANRMEEALLAAWEERRLDLPVISIDFSNESSVGKTINTLGFGPAKVAAFPSCASAGGLEALRQLHAHLPEDLRRGAKRPPDLRARAPLRPLLRQPPVACPRDPAKLALPSRCPETPHRPLQGQGSLYA